MQSIVTFITFLDFFVSIIVISLYMYYELHT